MNRRLALFSVGMAFMASTAFGAGTRSRLPELTLGRSLFGRLQSPDLATPTPLSTVPTPLTPDLALPPNPVPEVQYNGPVAQLPVVTTPIELFQCVKYRDSRKIAPCAVPIVVAVPNPCVPADRCSTRACVYVEICVPNCGCPTVCVTRNGNKTRYDYGKYAIDIVCRNGKIIVDYDN